MGAWCARKKKIKSGSSRETAGKEKVVGSADAWEKAGEKIALAKPVPG
jgi:hypothetical protein